MRIILNSALLLFLLINCALAQTTSKPSPRHREIMGCVDTALARAHSELKELLDEVKQKDIGVKLIITSNKFVATARTSDFKWFDKDGLIINFYCTTTYDSVADKGNCTGVLWHSSIPR